LLPRRVATSSILALALIGLTVAGPVAAAEPVEAGATIATTMPWSDPIPRPTVLSTRAPSSMNLYRAEAFRFQDPYGYACTSAASMDMLNFISHAGSGGSGFVWDRTRSGSKVASMLTWARTHDTLRGGNGSDPHGWRNMLNYYGWGSTALREGARVYEDTAYRTYSGAVKSAVRAMIRTRKPVGVLAWAGRHGQMITGYYGLSGDPFAKRSDGTYKDAFSVGGFYLSDPLRKDGFVDIKVSYARFRDTTDYRLRFRRYTETDSLLDDPYTSGSVRARDEWYGKFVLIIPRR